MSEHSLIVSLLTEIRDNQLEEIEWRKRAIEESIRLQRVAIRRQSVALLTVAVMLVAVFVAAYVLLTVS